MRLRKLILAIITLIVITVALIAGNMTAEAQTIQEPGAPHDGYIVKLAPLRRSVLSTLSADLEPVPYSDALYLTDDPITIDNLIGSGMVEYVEPNYILEPLGDPLSSSPNDTRFADQWTLDAIKYLSLYEGGYDGGNVTVAVIDSGLYAWRDEFNVYHGHEEFENVNISTLSKNFLGTGTEEERSPYYYRDQTNVGHGTFVTSQIAAMTDNGKGMTGIADNVELLILRCISDSGSQVFAYDDKYDANGGSIALVASAIRYAVDCGADVINLSLGGKIQETATLQDAVNYADSRGVIIVAAAGNDGDGAYFYPAACEHVIGVGSVSQSGTSLERSYFSQFNSSVSVTAPGGAVLGASVYPSSSGIVYTNPEDSYISSSGTSYSSPVVTALAAIVKSINPQLDHDDFEAILAVSSKDLGADGWDPYFGYGVLDAAEILTALTVTEYEIDYQLCDSVDTPATLPAGSAVTYTLGRYPDLTLPIPTRIGYSFEGWYRSADYSGNHVEVLPRGDFGMLLSSVSGEMITYYIEGLKFYAKWSENPPLGIKSITVLGQYQASLSPESTVTYEVTIPKSAIDSLDNLTVGDISVVTSSAVTVTISKVSGEGIQDGSRWIIGMPDDPSSTYYLDIIRSTYDIPSVAEDVSLELSGTAMLPSLDGLQPAEAYTADISSWFTDAATDYIIVSSEGGGEAKIEVVTEGEETERVILTYAPDSSKGDYKDQRVTIVLKAKNEDFESPDSVTVTITIGRHESNSAITPASDIYDMYTESAGVNVDIALFGNIFTGIHYKDFLNNEIPVSQSSYTTTYTDDLADSVKFTLSHGFLSSLPSGVYNFVFSFSAGEPRTLVLTINDSAPRYTVKFYTEKADLTTLFNTVSNVRSGSKLTLPASEPVKAGYIFLGWFLSDDTTMVTGNTVVTADLDAFAKWSEEEDGGGGGGGGGGGFMPPPIMPPIAALDIAMPDITVPITGGSQSAEVIVTISEEIVTVEPLSDTELQSLIGAAAAAGRLVSIDLSSLDAKLDTAIIPRGILSGVTASDAPGLAITMPDGKSVSFDSTALGTLVSADSGDFKLVVREIDSSKLTDNQKSLVGDAPVIDLTAFMGKKQIHDFGGGMATVSIPIAGKPLENPIVWRMATDADGKINLEAIECAYNAKTKCYEFRTGSFSKYAIGNYPFTDTPDGAWYYEDVVYAHANGLFSGTMDKTFSPNLAITRSMLVTVLWRMENEPEASSGSLLDVESSATSFSDVSADAWYSDAVAWASANGIVGGYGNGKFGPDDNISREQMAAILYRYAQYKGYDVSVGEDTNILSYKDVFDISEYAIPAFQWACGAGLMQGSDGSLMPRGEATRAQVAAILHRFCGNAA